VRKNKGNFYERFASNKDFSSFNIFLGGFFVGNSESPISIFIKYIIFSLIYKRKLCSGGRKFKHTTGEIVSSRGQFRNLVGQDSFSKGFIFSCDKIEKIQSDFTSLKMR